MVLAEVVIFVISLFILSKSSNYVIDNALKLSNFFGINQMTIGFLLVAISTSLPELSVSIFSAGTGHGSIAAGNVFGSNIANILLVLGLGAFLYGFRVPKKDLKDIGLVLVLTTLISIYIIANSILHSQALGFVEGIVLLVLFAGYAYYVLQKESKGIVGYREKVDKKEALRAFLLFSGSILLVVISSGFVVDSAVKLARLMNLAESFIGATMIAVGTSLPELMIDLQAIRRKQYGIAIGDAIGSNMANLTLVLGTASLMNPISVKLPVFIAALLFAIASNMIFFYVAAVDRRVQKQGGAFFLVSYVFYIIVILTLQVTNI